METLGKIMIAISIALMVLVFGRAACAEQPIPDEEWTPDARLWLARSLVGEAGFVATEEHAAIAWVYAERWQMSKTRSFLETVRAYSAAVHGRSNRRHPWIHHLAIDGSRPSGWPSGALWSRRREAWLDVLAWCDGWAAGHFETPCPGATHYGGPCDDHRAREAGWAPIRCQVRTANRFYDGRRRVSRPRVVVPGSPEWRRRMRDE